MNYVSTVSENELHKLGFVPNKRTAHHNAWCRIGGHTVWCEDFHAACKLRNRIMKVFYAQGRNVRYRCETVSGSMYEYNW